MDKEHRVSQKLYPVDRKASEMFVIVDCTIISLVFSRDPCIPVQKVKWNWKLEIRNQLESRSAPK